MTCAELRDKMDAYARGLLPPGEAAALEDHLTRCAECSAALERSEARSDAAITLPRSVDPADDLWPGIQSRLSRRQGLARRRIGVPGWLLAAAAVLLVAVSSGVTALVLRQRSSQLPPQQSERLSALEVGYTSATADLTAALERARNRLAPATIATIEHNLTVINNALAESRRALARDPDNAALEQLVVAAWRQKMDLLRRAAALTKET